MRPLRLQAARRRQSPRHPSRRRSRRTNRQRTAILRVRKNDPLLFPRCTNVARAAIEVAGVAGVRSRVNRKTSSEFRRNPRKKGLLSVHVIPVVQVWTTLHPGSRVSAQLVRVVAAPRPVARIRGAPAVSARRTSLWWRVWSCRSPGLRVPLRLGSPRRTLLVQLLLLRAPRFRALRRRWRRIRFRVLRRRLQSKPRRKTLLVLSAGPMLRILSLHPQGGHLPQIQRTLLGAVTTRAGTPLVRRRNRGNRKILSEAARSSMTTR